MTVVCHSRDMPTLPKRAYRSRAAAKKFLRAAGDLVKTQEPYLCPTCGQWHTRTRRKS